LTAVFAALVACSPQAPAQNATTEVAPAENVAVAPVAAENAPQTGLLQVPLTIRSANGEHRFTVAVAATPAQQERGLMFRRSLEPNEGMIFPYSPPQDVSFWMHNTLIPLDIIFIRADGKIARITRARALDDTPLPSGEAVATVLEIAGGRAAELGIREGDVASWQPLPVAG
jgi:uncharacterized protein